MDKKILELEKSLFKYEYMSNKEYLENVIDDEFIECGKSGCFFDKTETIQDLNKLTTDRKIDIYNYECQSIDTNTYLVHYITISNNDKIYRTSLWVMRDNLKLLFHQASTLSGEIELVKF